MSLGVVLFFVPSLLVIVALSGVAWKLLHARHRGLAVAVVVPLVAGPLVGLGPTVLAQLIGAPFWQILTITASPVEWMAPLLGGATLTNSNNLNPMTCDRALPASASS